MPTVFKDNLDNLLVLAGSYMDYKGLDLIRKAYEFTVESNRRYNLLRYSGEPSIVHSLAVAETLVKWRLDPTTVSAGILHDIIEDPNIHSVQLRATFGEDVTRMVEGVSKLKKFEIPETTDADTAYYYKIFLAVARDTRVALIKIADRLHNLRTLEALPNYKRIKNAYETQRIFIPLSRFLGMEAVAEEMEDIAFQYSNPEEYTDLLNFMERIQDEENELFDRVLIIVRESLARLGIEGQARVFRYNLYHMYKIRNQTEPPMPRTGLIEITVPEEPDCYTALHALHRTFQSLSMGFQDTIHFPSIDLKRMIETSLLDHYGRPFIALIVSREMKEVNRFGVVPYLASPESLMKTDFLAERVELIQRIVDEFRAKVGEIDEDTFVRIMTGTVLKKQIFVFTTDGRRLELPESSTVLDFAYQVGPETGNHFKSALVNGIEVGIEYAPRRFDRITIITDPDAEPRVDWLEKAQTPEAQMLIRKSLAARPRERSVDDAREALLRTAREMGLSTSGRIDDLERLLTPVVEFLSMKTIEDFYLGVGRGDIGIDTASEFMREQFRRTLMIDAAELEPVIKGQAVYRKELPHDYIETERPVRSALYSCEVCSPLPGDEIFVIASGRRGIIHRAECGRRTGRAFLRGRKIAASWKETTGRVFPSRIKIKSLPAGKVKQRIFRALEVMGAGVISSQSGSVGSEGLEMIEFIIEAHNALHVKSVCDELLKLKEVIVATRI